MQVCGRALEVNAELIGADQAEYQKMLVDGFQELVAKLAGLFNEEVHVVALQPECVYFTDIFATLLCFCSSCIL